MKIEPLPMSRDESGKYSFDETTIPFNGQSVLIQTRHGMVEATWEPHWYQEGKDRGYQWNCYGAPHEFDVDLEDVIGWCPLPESLPIPIRNEDE